MKRMRGVAVTACLSATLIPMMVTGCAQQADSVDAYLRAIEFSGAALVVRNGDVVLRAGFGEADRELHVANSPTSVFRIGSLTKPITATALLHLVERGDLELDDGVCEFLRVCPAEWHPVRIRQLLNHTSGIPDLFGALPSAPVLETPAEIDHLLEARTHVPLQSAPGTEYRYSNFNYMLAGYVLEVVAGTDWESYLRDVILQPIGVFATRYDDAWALIDGRVRGYRERDGRIEPIAYKDHSAYAAGGLLSTVDDLHQWHASLVSGKIISTDMFEAAVQPAFGDYGLGWQVLTAFSRELQNHSGGISGFSSHLAWYPADGLLIVLLSNVAAQNVKAIGCDVARLMFDDPEPPAPTSSWLSAPTDVRCRQARERDTA